MNEEGNIENRRQEPKVAQWCRYYACCCECQCECGASNQYDESAQESGFKRKNFVYFLILVAFVIMIGTGVFIQYIVQTSVMTIQMEKICINEPNSICGYAQYSSKIGSLDNRDGSSFKQPLAILVHDSFGRKEMMLPLSLELSAKGFITYSFDLPGYGDTKYIGSTTNTIVLILDHFKTLNIASKIGLVGHGYGAYAAMEATKSFFMDSVVLIGGGFSDPNTVAIEEGQNLAGSGTVYGDFTNGTARAYQVFLSGHLMEAVDKTAIACTINWLKDALEYAPPTWKPSTNPTTYMFRLLGGAVATLGLVFSFVPVTGLLRSTWMFRILKDTWKSEYRCGKLRFLSLSTIHICTSYLALVCAGICSIFLPWPQKLGSFFVLWFTSSALIQLVVAWILMLRRNCITKSKSMEWNDFGIYVGDGTRSFVAVLFKSLIVSFLCIAWFVACYYLPLLSAVTSPARIGYAVVYVPFAFFYILVDSMWINGLLRTSTAEEEHSSVGKYISWFLSVLTTKMFPIGVIILVDLLAPTVFLACLSQKNTNTGLSGAFISHMYTLIFPILFETVFLTWSYHATGNGYIGAVCSSVLFGWVLGAWLPCSV